MGKGMRVFRVMFGILFIFSALRQVFADDILREDGSIDVGRLNSYIRSKGARWIAKSNKFTQMTPEERKRLLGLIIRADTLLAGSREFAYPRIAIEERIRKVPLPPQLDWRDKDGKNWMTSVKKQHAPDSSGCGACWAFAAVGQVEALVNIAENDTGIDLDLSEQYLVSDCCNAGNCGGGNPFGALEYIRNTGIPLELCFPYEGHDTICDPCSDWKSQARRIADCDLVCYLPNETAMKEALLNHPLTTAMMVYEDFIAYSGGIYEHVSGSYLGGHAIVLVGWNDSLSYWIAKNSWTENWGENGYFRIKYGECLFGMQTCDATYDPLFVDAGNDTIINYGDTIQLSPIVTGGAPDYSQAPIEYTYLWSPSSGLSDTSIRKPKAFPCTTTIYTLRVTDLNNVLKSDSIKITLAGKTDEKASRTPDGFFVSQNYPNPFMEFTEIRYGLPISAYASIIVYNLAGQRVAVLLNELVGAGYYRVRWIGRDERDRRVGSGIYFYRFEVCNPSGLREWDFYFTSTKKMYFAK